MTDLQITVLVEETARRQGLLAEHGLALWIEIDGHRVLFDAGQTMILWDNARALHIGLGTADSIVLSHGHYDHTGGLGAVLQETGPVNVFLHPDALGAKYAATADGSGRPVGITASNREALKAIATLIYTEKPTQITPRLWCTGPIPRDTDFEDTGGAFFTDPTCRTPDLLSDDQALYADTTSGTVVVTGCAHAGMINTLRYVRTLRPERPIHTVIGGLHLITAGRERINKTVDALRELDVQRLYPLHCTGFQATVRLWNEFPGRVSTCPVGSTLEV